MSHLKLVFLFFILSGAQAQQKYWVYQTPENKKDSLLTNLNEVFCSQWINACSYYLTENQRVRLIESGLSVLPVHRFYYQSSNGLSSMGFAIEQIEGQLLQEAGLTGKGVKVGVIDGGFSGIDRDPTVKILHDENRIIAFKDYIKSEELVEISDHSSDTHGTEVLQLIAGYHPERDILFGLATEAIFYLARTDFEGYEKRIEEDNLIAAMEWMAAEGVQIINISLGYTRGYNDKSENYRPDQMDGQTSVVAKAVEHGAKEKGLLIIVAAGNEANNMGWNILSTPGDARHALTVGSSQLLIWDKARFSSIGPQFLSYVKPDVVVFSGSGTSFSAPIITGLAACIKHYDPGLSSQDIIRIIKESSHLYPYPNNHIGYGVPQCKSLLHILNNKPSEVLHPEVIVAKKNRIRISLIHKEDRVVLLHKNSDHHVIKRIVVKPKRSYVTIKRTQMAHQTTLLYDHLAKEVFWESSK